VDVEPYLRAVLGHYAVDDGPGAPGRIVAEELYPHLTTWAGEWLQEVSYSGSFRKGTGIAGSTDVDLFVSLSANTPITLHNIYWNLVGYLKALGLAPRAQDVSVGITYRGVSVDIVPGRLQPRAQIYHWLYRRKADTWTQTSVEEHVRIVRESGRTEEIRALKLWRLLRGLEFPSFYLEMAVIDALWGREYGALQRNIVTVLEYLCDTLPRRVLVDPSNTANRVSDDLTIAERRRISLAASTTLEQRWIDFIW
jgi:hypothetical protein